LNYLILSLVEDSYIVVILGHGDETYMRMASADKNKANYKIIGVL
jgi:hypothetical protein